METPDIGGLFNIQNVDIRMTCIGYRAGDTKRNSDKHPYKVSDASTLYRNMIKNSLSCRSSISIDQSADSDS